LNQNISTAVMQRRVEAHDSLDDFPTPPWATRALCEYVIWPSGAGWPKDLKSQTCWEPACNRGHMVKPLREYFGLVWASDILDYGCGAADKIEDFLFPGTDSPFASVGGLDWIITNPPFRLAEQFIIKSQRLATVGSAVIVRSAFLESVGRYDSLFRDNPPNIIAQFTERVVMVKGRLDGKGSTATSYCWLVWASTLTGARMMWIPPCRKSLERPNDYLEAA
jgi:hypothetical protein